jgi:predicted nucleotidyltransferase
MQESAAYDKIKQKILEGFPDVMGIYLFGSRADGTSHANSDFDLAFLLPNNTPLNDLKIFHLQQDLAATLNQDVDLICLNTATLVMQFQITSYGLLLFEKDHREILKYETLVLSMYQRFSEERKPVLQEIETSGKIYSA